MQVIQLLLNNLASSSDFNYFSRSDSIQGTKKLRSYQDMFE